MRKPSQHEHQQNQEKKDAPPQQFLAPIFSASEKPRASSALRLPRVEAQKHAGAITYRGGNATTRKHATEQPATARKQHLKISVETFQKMDILASMVLSKEMVKKPKERKYFPKTAVSASFLDDLYSKRAIAEAFKGESGSYLECVHEAHDAAIVPTSTIPEEHFIYSNSPLQQGFSSTDDV